MRPLAGRTVTAAAISALLATTASAGTYVCRLLADTDSNPATGCSVPVDDAGGSGTFAGVDRGVAVTVESAASGGTVTGVTALQCVAGVLKEVQQVSAGGWPIGCGAGAGGTDVIEAAVPLSLLGDGTLARVAFTASRAVTGSDVTATTDGDAGGPSILFQLPFTPVPALSLPGLAAWTVALGALACLALQRRAGRRAVTVLAQLLAGGAASVALALTIQPDGQVSDWQSVAPVATDPSGDSSLGDLGEDLVAGFLTADSANLYLRFDVVDITSHTVTLTFNVTVPPSTDGTGHSVYIAGTLDRLYGGLPAWNPGGVVLTKVDATHWTVTLTGKDGTQIEYKYTLGDRDHVEKDAACGEINNRQVTLSYGATGFQTVNDTVLNWRNVSPCAN